MFFIETANAELPIDPVEEQRIFDFQPKCKVSMQVTSTKNVIENDNGPYGCYGTFYIYGVSENGKTSIHGMNQAGECVGSDPTFSTAYGKNIPKIGETIYAIVNLKSYEVIKYGKADYNNHSEIPPCTGNQGMGLYFALGGILLLFAVIFIFFFLKRKRKNKKR